MVKIHIYAMNFDKSKKNICKNNSMNLETTLTEEIMYKKFYLHLGKEDYKIICKEGHIHIH